MVTLTLLGRRQNRRQHHFPDGDRHRNAGRQLNDGADAPSAFVRQTPFSGPERDTWNLATLSTTEVAMNVIVSPVVGPHIGFG